METNFKVGQRVMILGTVESINENDTYSVKVKTEGGKNISFTEDGKLYTADQEPSLQPYVEPFRKREMLVWNNDEKEAIIRTVVSNFNGKWQAISSIDGIGIVNWKNAKESEFKNLQLGAVSSRFYDYDKRGVRAFVRYSTGNGGWAIECYRKKSKDESKGDHDWQMVREGHIQSYGSREEAEQKVLELAEQVCLENGY